MTPLCLNLASLIQATPGRRAIERQNTMALYGPNLTTLEVGNISKTLAIMNLNTVGLSVLGHLQPNATSAFVSDTPSRRYFSL